jgi:hypothetical protein
MKPSGARKRLLARLETDADSLVALPLADAISAMLAFYAEERAEGCSLDDDGDMLLYQWGTNDWGEGESFEFNIARQFINARDEVSQLSLTYGFAVSKETKTVGDGNKWCESPDELEKFRRFVTGSKAYKLVSSVLPIAATVELKRT